MTVTDVEIGHARPARSPNTKAAINYLEASGATAITITITAVDGVCSFRVGSKLLARSVAIFWIMQVDAKPVVTSARKIAGTRTSPMMVLLIDVRQRAGALDLCQAPHGRFLESDFCGTCSRRDTPLQHHSPLRSEDFADWVLLQIWQLLHLVAVGGCIIFGRMLL